MENESIESDDSINFGDDVKTRRANVRLSEGDYIFLKELAKERCCSVSEIVRNWIADRVMTYKQHRDVASMASFMNAVFNSLGQDVVQGAFIKDLQDAKDINISDVLKINRSDKH